MPPMAPEAAEAWFGTAAPPALAVESPMAAAAAAASADPDSKWFGLTAGIHRAVPGVAVNLTDVHQPVAVQDAVVADANAAFDKLHGGWAQEMQQVCPVRAMHSDYFELAALHPDAVHTP